MTLFDIYKDGLGTGKDKHRFRYDLYEMQRFDKIGKIYFKINYMPELSDRLKAYEAIDKIQSNPKTYIPKPTQNKSFARKSPFKDFGELEDFKNKNRLFYRNDSKISDRRFLEIEIYIKNILNEAETKQHPANIDFLIDQMFTLHTGVLSDTKADFVFSEEINAFIFKVLHIELKRLASTPIMSMSEQMEKALENRSLKWKLDKRVLGTLFGVIYSTGAIEGNKTDLAKGLKALFPDLSKHSILDNFKLKNPDKHNPETVHALKEFEKYLRNLTDKKG